MVSAEEVLERVDDMDIGGGSGFGGGGGGRRGGRGGKGGRGGRGGRGGGGGGENREVAISKALSKLLRHDAVSAGLKMDREGFACVEDVLEWPRLKSLKVSMSELQAIVSDNAKQRFSLKPSSPSSDPTSTNLSDWLIRANQGHSITIDSSSLLTPLTLSTPNLPSTVVHGTYFGNYQSILDSGGLKPMGRNHVHFSKGLIGEEGVISGMRNDAELLVYVDLKKSLEDGGVWWESENGVILTEGVEGVVETKYWKRVVGKREDVGVLWEDGVETKKLEEKYRSRKAPMGKARGGGGGRGRGGRGGRGGGRGRGRGSGKELEGVDSLGGEGSAATNEP